MTKWTSLILLILCMTALDLKPGYDVYICILLKNPRPINTSVHVDICNRKQSSSSCDCSHTNTHRAVIRDGTELNRRFKEKMLKMLILFPFN